MFKFAMPHHQSAPVGFVACLVLGALVVQVAGAAQASADNHDDAQHQPAPEPYSFSYSADSIGGQSSHQESGDASGRVTGFYTILGEDGRERRVDYVADENGYRATISTNEVGTRAESSADAQYNVRLPSEKQLEAAKVTVEQYKFLEETHANERQLQLSRLSSNRQQQQQSSRQQTSSFQASSAGSSFNQNTNNQAAGGQRQLHNQQQHSAAGTSRQQAELSVSSAGGASLTDIDSDWRQRDSSGARVSSQKLAASGTGAAWSQGNSRLQGQLQQQQPQQASFAGQSESSFSASSTSGSFAGVPDNSAQLNGDAANQLTVATGAQQRLDGAQQVQVAAWQMANRGAVPARKQTTILQRQMDQQFMQQLSDQDYPRQTTSEQANQLAATNSLQRQQFVAQHQPSAQFSGQFSSYATTNNQASGSPNADQLDQQQQNNIIDETPEQPDSGVAVVSQEPSRVGPANEQFASITSTQTSINNIKQQQQQQQPAPGPTQTAPAGFVAINLNRDETSSQLSDGNQEVDQRPAPVANVQFGSNQATGSLQSGQEELVQTTQTGGASGQAEMTTGTFGSINQIIQSQQVKGQQQQEVFGPTSTPASVQFRPTTVAAPIQTTSFEKLELATKLTSGPVETTTARQVFNNQAQTTTSSSASTTASEQPQTELTYEQNGPTSVKEVSSVVGVNRFQQQQQQQQQVKGGSRVQSNRFDRPTVNYGFAPIKTNQLAAWQTATTTTPGPQEVVSVQNEHRQSSHLSTSQQSEAAKIQPNVEDVARQPSVVATTAGYQANAVSQQQQLTGSANLWQQQPTTTTQQPSLRPARVEVQSQQQLKGTKGGSLRRKQQFWQQSSGSRVQQQQAPQLQQQQPVAEASQMSNFPVYGARVVAKRG